MTADTYSSTLGVLLMGTGNDNNSWGGNANTSVFQIFEDAIANTLTSGVTGGTLDLSGSPPPAGASQARYGILVFTGVLTSNQTVIVPNLSKSWIVYNNTSGSFVLLMKAAGGSTILIPQGMHCQVWCDGALTLRRLGARTGEIFSPGGGSLPAGAFDCDFSAYSRTTFSELFAVLGTTWGSGNGTTTFNVPQLQDTGRFLRCYVPASTSVGSTQANAFKSHTHSATGTTTGTASVTGTPSGSIANITPSGNISAITGTVAISDPTHTHTGTTDANKLTAGGGVVGGSGFLIGGGSISITAAGTGITATWGPTSAGTFTGNAVTPVFTGNSLNSTGSITASTSVSVTNTGDTETRPEAAIVRMAVWY